MNSKQFFFALNTDDTDEYLDTSKGFYREMWNMVPGNEVTSNPSRQNMRGTTRLEIDFDESATPKNKCIGAVSDTGRNRLVFFVHKPGGTDAIYLWNSGDSATTKIFEWSELNFSDSYPIEHAFIIGDLLYWVEKSNPQRCLNIKRALEGDYIGKEIEINLAKLPPIYPPVAQRTTDRDSELTSNRIAFNNYHFAYRYKYRDGIYSTISPYSLMVKSSRNPHIDDASRSVYVTITVPENIEDYVDEIEFLVDENKLNTWKVFHTYKNIDTSSSQDITVNFDGQNVLVTLSESEYELLFEPIPKISSAQALIKNRNIINGYKNGYEENGNYEISLSLLFNHVDDSEEYGELANNQKLFHFKSGGGYSVVLVFYDDFHRITSVRKKIPINVPFESVANVNLLYVLKRHYAKVALTGTPPSQAKYFSVCMTQETNYELYMQIPVNILFYISEFNEGDTIPNDTFKFDNAVYMEEPPDDFTNSLASFIHLLMPKNIPFLPDTSFQIRVIDDIVGTPLNTSIIEPILDVKGNKLVVGDLGIDNWNFLTVTDRASMMIEVFKPRQSIPEEYYEQGVIYPISEFSGTKYIQGDTNMVVSSISIKFSFENIKAMSEGFPDPPNAYAAAFVSEEAMVVEAPTDTFTASNISTEIGAKVESEQKKYNALIEATTISLGKYKFNFLSSFATTGMNLKPQPYIFKSYKSFTSVPSKTLDYTRIANNHGRTIILFEDEEEVSFPNLIIPSDVCLSDSQVNGLHTYNPINSYSLPNDRGDIVKMVSSNDVLVVVHERNITTMYPGESYVRQGANLSWTITDEFLSQDRKLKRSLGSQDPASIVEHDGRVYGFDRVNAEPWRRSEDGVTPLASTYGVKKWFVEKSRYYLGQDVQIVGGYDPYLSMYFITFPEVNLSEAITVGFSEKYKIWIGFYSFIPERYGYIGNSFLSFKDGVPWLHHSNEIRNRFYDNNYSSKIKMLVNNEYAYDKVFKAMAVEANKAWEATEITSPAGQSSRLPKAAFKKKGENYVADMLRDENTPAALIPTGKTGLLHGREIAGPSVEITLENDDTEHVKIRAVDMRYVKVSGNILV